MRTLILSIVFLPVLACSGSDDDDAKTTPDDGTPEDTGVIEPIDSSEVTDTGDTDTETTGPCLNQVVSRFPLSNATDAFFATSVEFLLNDVDETATIEVTGPDGLVPGQTEVLGKRVLWTGDDTFDPATTYDATLMWSCEPVTTTFTTSATGAEVDTNALDATAYRLDLAGGRWIQPTGLGPAIGVLLGADILIGVDSSAGDEIALTFARSDGFGGPQDICELTTAFPVASFARNPLFEAGPADVALSLNGSDLPVYGLELSGGFSADLAQVEGGRIAGLADLSPLSGPLAGSKDPEGICNLLKPFSITCLPCPNSGPVACVQIEVDSIAGVLEPGGVVPRTADDIALDPVCF